MAYEKKRFSPSSVKVIDRATARSKTRKRDQTRSWKHTLFGHVANFLTLRQLY
jgi:hypothetical protein